MEQADKRVKAEFDGGGSSGSFSPPDMKEILERNPKVDRNVVEAYKRLEAKLKRLGVEVRPRYTLGHPLGSGRPRDHNLNR